MTDAIKAPDYKRYEAAQRQTADRLKLGDVIATNHPQPRGRLGDDLRAKGAPSRSGS